MSDELDKPLREALRPVDPGSTFTDTVMTRIVTDKRSRLDPARPDDSRPAGRWIHATPWRWVSGAAVAIVLAALLVHTQQVRHTREGLAARQALMQALQVTARSLEVAKRAVSDSHGPDSGV
ncbi:MAG TPA: hypothetical protein VGM84_02145 [Steroidobacteraceae bacterium]|jgi:anti-sigma-K factor RskA